MLCKASQLWKQQLIVGEPAGRCSSPLNRVEEFSCCRGIEGLQGLLRFECPGRVTGMEITDAQFVVAIDGLRIEADRLLILRNRFWIAFQLVICKSEVLQRLGCWFQSNALLEGVSGL